VIALVEGKWVLYRVLENKDPEIAKRAEAKAEKKEKNERRRHERRPSLLERVLSGFLPED